MINYQTKKLDEICNVDYGTRIVKTRNIPGDFNVYGGGGKTFTSNEYNREDCFIVSRFAMSVNCVRKVQGKFFLNDSGLSVSTKDKNLLLQDFLDRFLLASQDLIYSLGRGQAQRNLHIEGFKNLEIPLPPLATQQKIVARLDELLGNIAEAKQLRQEAIADTEKILSQTLREIFEEGKEKGWEEEDLGKVCELIARGISPKYIETDGIVILNQKCIRDHLINYSPSRMHDKSKKFSDEKLIQVGDVLVNSTGVGTLGRVAQVKSIDFPTLVDSHVTIVRPLKNIFNLNYFGWMMVFVEDIIKEMGTGSSGQTELSRIALQKIKISYPQSLTEQEKLVSKLDILSAKLRELRQLQAEQLEDLKKLEKAYLREAFSGELV